MESISLAFSSGWASGVNAYMVVLILGIADRLGSYGDIPNVLGSWPVLAIAGFMYSFEFIADKIPYVDTTWDFISTVIRPTSGAAVGYLLAGDADSVQQAVMASTGGITAFIAHVIKTSTRMTLNSSPEPASNIITSMVEDVLVLGVIVLAIQHPVLAGFAAGALLILSIIFLFLLYKVAKKSIRFAYSKYKVKRESKNVRFNH